MAWVVADLKQKLKSNLEVSRDVEGADFVNIYATTILTYVLANTNVTYIWSGFNPSGVPDPVTTVPTTLSGGTPFTGPMSSVTEFYTKIATMIKSITITPGGGFIIAPTVFNPTYSITPTVSPANDTFDSALTCVCTDICNSFSQLTNPAPASGTHVAFTGVTTAMTVV